MINEKTDHKARLERVEADLKKESGEVLRKVCELLYLRRELAKEKLAAGEDSELRGAIKELKTLLNICVKTE